MKNLFSHFTTNGKKWLVAFSAALFWAAGNYAQPVTLNFLPQTQADRNHRLGAVAAFSVSYLPDQYRLYGTTWIQRSRWKSDSYDFWDYFYESNPPPTPTPTPPPPPPTPTPTPQAQFMPLVTLDPDNCSVKNSPLGWNDRCVDAIGVFTKRVACNPSVPNYACQNNDLWNAYPGRSNMSTFPVRPASDSAFGWPSSNAWGVKNYQPIINKNTVNYQQPNPPLSGKAGECHPNNPHELATGAQNAKVAQVKYPNGSTRWFMAFNNQVHSEENYGRNASDLWRVQWASSNDGFTWTTENRPLMLDLTETMSCSQGLYVVDMFVDNGYFYLIGNRVYLDHLWLMRSKIDFNSTTGPGYDPNSWEVRGTYNTSAGKYNWISIPAAMLGTHVNFTGIGAEPILPTRFGLGHYGGALKHTIISRVFSSSNPNSPSQFVALTLDHNQTVPASKPILELWTASSLDQRFVFQSNVQNAPWGGYGYEMSFVHHADNTAATPRVYDPVELWISQDVSCEGRANCCPASVDKDNCPAGTSHPELPRIFMQWTVTRRFAALAGGIYGN